MDGEVLIFGEKERAALVALIELWNEGTGDPIDAETLARRAGISKDDIWWRIRVSRSLRLAWEPWPGPVTEGWIPLVTADQVPKTQPYPPQKPWKPAEKREARAAIEERRRRRNY